MLEKTSVLSISWELTLSRTWQTHSTDISGFAQKGMHIVGLHWASFILQEVS